MKAITESFNFTSPTQSVFGVGALKGIGEKAAALGRKALLVTDGYMAKTEVVKQILGSLKEKDVEAVVMGNVVPNPLDKDVQAGVEAYKKNQCDIIIAVGGGSSIDSGKAIGAIVSNGGRTQDLLDAAALKKALPPFIAAPTTAGTGSEVTIFAVITDSATHEKLILFSPKLLPTVAILDPAVTVSLPPDQTAFTGLDALTHAIEAYTTKVSNPISDGLACNAIELVGKYLERAYKKGEDLEARAGMLLASHLAGIAFSNADLGSVHTMGEVLAGACNIPHGAAMAIFLPYIMEFSSEAAADKYAVVARLFGQRAEGKLAIERIKQLERTLKLPPLSSFGIKPARFAELAQACKKHVCDPLNPREIGEAEYLKLYQRAFGNEYKI
jgi:alcohol dehydrogenase